jgi:thiol-disulfide isomerase/thioredoxin
MMQFIHNILSARSIALPYLVKCMALLMLVASMNDASGSEEFVLTDMRGNTHRLSDYRGKWVLVNYWATWCPPCLEEVPDLVMLYDQYKDDGLMVFGIAQQYKSRQEVVAFVDDMLMSYPIVLGNATVNAQFGPNEILPTTFIYNPRGELVRTRRGLITRAYIRELLAGRLPDG